MLESLDYTTILFDIIIAIISAIIVVPLILKINSFLEFTECNYLLTEEIRQNLVLIEELPYWLSEVRTRHRPWLPGINSNHPQPGYVLKYLSMNNYQTFLNQKYWTYLERGHADKLSELYEFFRRYCDLIQQLQTRDDNGNPIQRDQEQHVLDPNLYSDERFFSSMVILPSGQRAILRITQNMIHQHATSLDIDNLRAFRKEGWWYPLWFKKLLRLIGYPAQI